MSKGEIKCHGNCITCGKCNNFRILDQYAQSGTAHEPREGYGIAIDIGTTTVVLTLVDLTIGTTLARHSFLNPQRKFGPDVISRIDAANKGHLDELTQAIKTDTASAVRELLKTEDILPESITQMAIAGNTTMIYLLLGLSCESLGVQPFKPAFPVNDSYTCASLFDIPGVSCDVFVLPYLAAFIGGDITAGLLHTMAFSKQQFLLLDLGTNGEMGLYKNGELIVTATAAGPAFDTIGRGGASGVISVLANMLSKGDIDESGFLCTESSDLSQTQVRELQLAKSAVRTGVEILIKESGLSYDDLEALYLAGGIGQAIDVSDACAIGLIPSELENKAISVGNVALGGAVSLLLAPGKQWRVVENLLASAKEINLSTHRDFSDFYMDFMFFE